MINHSSSPRSFKYVLLFILLTIVSIFVMTQAETFAADENQQVTTISRNELSTAKQVAQQIATSDAQVATLLNGNRAEVFDVYSVSEHFAGCGNGTCYQTNIYDFDANTTLNVIVNIKTEQVINLTKMDSSHPSSFNSRLNTLARETIATSPEVKEALGYAPALDEVLLMTANHADSEHCSKAHFCAAAVFLIDGGVVWVMYDATLEKIDKIWWDGRPINITDKYEYRNRTNEKESEIESIPIGCNVSTAINQDGWTLDYETTDSDALRINNVTFNGKLVMTSASMVEWKASYGSWGYRDSTGCLPSGSSSGQYGFVINPFGDTELYDLFDSNNNRVGFELRQDFRMRNWGRWCNYRYEQRLQFYTDGRWRLVDGIFGRGCGNSQESEATYRPVWRIDIAVDDSGNDAFQTWDGSDWQISTTEDWYLQGDHSFSPEGYSYRIYDIASGNGFYIEPGAGQFNDGGTGDNAYIYITENNSNENPADFTLLPDTSASADDHQQGPHEYINGDNLVGKDIVLWYVPQVDTISTWQANATGDDIYCWTEANSEFVVTATYPCFSGPMFHPTNNIVSAVDLVSLNTDPIPLGYLLVVASIGFALLTGTILTKGAQRKEP